MMMNEEIEDKTDKAYGFLLQNLLVKAYINLVFMRTDLYLGIKTNKITPKSTIGFLRSFKNFYGLICGLVIRKQEKFAEEIERYFEVMKVDKEEDLIEGIRLSETLQKFIEGQSIFKLFESDIEPLHSRMLYIPN